eukprot:9068054-Pyramimonas_sp.AAC.1
MQAAKVKRQERYGGLFGDLWPAHTDTSAAASISVDAEPDREPDLGPDDFDQFEEDPWASELNF